MDKIKTLEEAKQLLAEYNALPDDLTARLCWNGYERLPELTIHCSNCGKHKSYPLSLDDIIWSVKHNQLKLTGEVMECEKCREPEDDED